MTKKECIKTLTEIKQYLNNSNCYDIADKINDCINFVSIATSNCEVTFPNKGGVRVKCKTIY